MSVLIDKILTEALSWNGYTEKKASAAKRWDEAYLLPKTANAGADNYTIFAKWYRDYWGEDLQGEPWCAIFISCVMRRALGPDVQAALAPYYAGCTTGTNVFKKMGIWHTGGPQRGDIIMFKDARSPGTQAHTGLVTNADNKYVYTVEGNTSGDAGVVANGGSVNQKSYALTYSMIAGYIRPNYQKYEQGDDLTNEQYNEVKRLITALTSKVNTPTKVYDTVAELPLWAQTEVQKALDLGILTGTTHGKLGLSDQDLKAVIFAQRVVTALTPKVYDTMEEVPEWARDDVKTALAKGILRGNGKGFGLTAETLTALVFTVRGLNI